MRVAALRVWLLDLLFPAFCVKCGDEGRHLCPACHTTLRTNAPACPVCGKRNFSGVLCASCRVSGGLRRFLSPYSYRDPIVRELIHAYKYGGVRELASFFADDIAAFLASYAVRPRRTAP